MIEELDQIHLPEQTKGYAKIQSTYFRTAAQVFSLTRMAGASRLTSLCLRVLGGGQRLAPGGQLGLSSSLQQRLNPGQFLQSRFLSWLSKAAKPFMAS